MTRPRHRLTSGRRAGALSGAALALVLAAPAALLALMAPAGAAAPQPLAASPSPSPAANCTGTSSGGDPSIVVEYASTKASGSQARQCTPAANSTLTGTWSVDIQARSINLTSFAVSIIPTTSGIPALASAATVTHTYCGGLLGGLGLSGNCPAAPDPDTIQIGWDTTSLTPYNGVYEISATATSGALLGSPTGQTTTISGLNVNNPPQSPTGVTAGLSGTVPVVSWSPNPEPDITDYAVFRSVSNTAFAPVGTTKATAFQDSSAPQNAALTYAVIAVRSSPVSSSGIPSTASAVTTVLVAGASAPLPISLPALKLPPPPKLPTLKSVTAPETIPQADNTFNPDLPFGNAP
ncbi:MAG: hypothetical protein ACRDJU_08810, partial [Actinomycetota bacterium]